MSKKIVMVSLLTVLHHIPVLYCNSLSKEDEKIVFVSLHTIKGHKLLKFHTESSETVFDFVPNNKSKLNTYVIAISQEEADRLRISYTVNPKYPKTILDGKIEVDDESEATVEPIGVRPPAKKKEKRMGPIPFPTGSSLSQITRGKNKGKWGVWGLEGVQNSLIRYSNIPFFVVKHTYAAVTNANPEGITYTFFHPFTTEDEANEYAKQLKNSDVIEVSQWLLTADQIVR